MATPSLVGTLQIYRNSKIKSMKSILILNNLISKFKHLENKFNKNSKLKTCKKIC
jgi:hypothetical protein